MKRILVLEDSLIVRKLLVSLLQARGYTVVECDSIADAKGRLKNIDLAILDYQLPDGDGLEIAERLRSYHPGIPMFLLTARGNRVSEEDAQKAGIREYMEKPIDPDAILDAVDLCLNQKAA